MYLSALRKNLADSEVLAARVSERVNMGEGVLWLLCPALASGAFYTKVSLQSDRGKVSLPLVWRACVLTQPGECPVLQCGRGRTPSLPLRHTSWSPHMAPAIFLWPGHGSLAARDSGKQSVVVTFLITVT